MTLQLSTPLLRKELITMDLSRLAVFQKDRGGRRSGIDRRQFSYTVHIPERRCADERRSGIDRRGRKDRRKSMDASVNNDRRSGTERRFWFL